MRPPPLYAGSPKLWLCNGMAGIPGWDYIPLTLPVILLQRRQRQGFYFRWKASPWLANSLQSGEDPFTHLPTKAALGNARILYYAKCAQFTALNFSAAGSYKPTISSALLVGGYFESGGNNDRPALRGKGPSALI